MKQLYLLAALCMLASTWGCQKPASEILTPNAGSKLATLQEPVLSEMAPTTTATIVYSKVTIADYGTCNMVTYTPAGASESKKLPVIVFTPGNGEVGTDSSKLYLHGPLKYIKSGWRPTNFILVGIQPLFGCSSASPRFAHNMLTAIRKNPLVDTNQVYMTGLSGGAFTTLHYIRDYPTPYKIRAIMVFSIDMASKCTGALCGNDLRFKDIPSWGMCGDVDTRMEPSMKNYFGLLKTAGYTTQYNEYPGGHGSWNTYYDPNWTKDGYSVYSWMLKWGAPANKKIQVNVTGSTSLSSSWNNLIDTASVLKYPDGITSGVTARLSHKTSVVDNGATYATNGTNMAPAEILRFAVCDTIARTLTLSNLNPAKTYDIELYASRGKNSTEKTVFTIATTGSVPTYNNMTNKVLFQNIVPDAYNRIVVQLKSAVKYNYLNGFTLTEITK